MKLKILDIEGNEAGEGNVEGEEVEVETYIWVAGEERLADGEWDFAEFRREKMHNWITSSDEYDGESCSAPVFPLFAKALVQRSMKRLGRMTMTRQEVED